MKKLLALALALLMVAALFAGCGSPKEEATEGNETEAEQTVLTMATNPEFPPFESIENGEIVGADIDMINAICDKLGMSAKKEFFKLYEGKKIAELPLDSLYEYHTEGVKECRIPGDSGLIRCDIGGLMGLLYPDSIISEADKLFENRNKWIEKGEKLLMYQIDSYEEALDLAESGHKIESSGNSEKRYKLAFSVAGTQSGIIGDVCEKLVEKGFDRDEIFFYKWQPMTLNGGSGNIKARNLYSEESERVIVVLSKEYAERLPTANMEWAAISARLGPKHFGEVCLLKCGEFEYPPELGIVKEADFTYSIGGLSADVIADRL